MRVRKTVTGGVLLKKGVHKNVANFTGRQLCWSLFLIKLQALRSATLLKRDSNRGIFLRNLRNIIKGCVRYIFSPFALEIINQILTFLDI